MKAFFESNGTIVIQADNDTENFAIERWYGEWRDGNKLAWLTHNAQARQKAIEFALPKYDETEEGPQPPDDVIDAEMPRVNVDNIRGTKELAGADITLTFDKAVEKPKLRQRAETVYAGKSLTQMAEEAGERLKAVGEGAGEVLQKLADKPKTQTVAVAGFDGLKVMGTNVNADLQKKILLLANHPHFQHWAAVESKILPETVPDSKQMALTFILSRGRAVRGEGGYNIDADALEVSFQMFNVWAMNMYGESPLMPVPPQRPSEAPAATSAGSAQSG